MKYFTTLFSHWTSYASLLSLVISFETPSINAYIGAHPHTVFAILLGAALAAYHATAPKDKDSNGPTGPQAVKAIALGFVLLALVQPGFTQTAPPATPAPIANIYAAGISFDSGASPAIAGTGIYAHLVNDGSGTYAFTVVDVLPASVNPFTVTTNFSGGIAQKVFSIGKVPIFVPSSAGISYTGTNTGWAWSTGAMAPIKIKGNWRIFPNVRVVKSSVGGSGYRPVVGLLFGYAE